jgi:hypothetical protein
LEHSFEDVCDDLMHDIVPWISVEKINEDLDRFATGKLLEDLKGLNFNCI